MSIRRAKRDQCFTLVGNHIFQEGHLSFQAMGMLTYLLSKPDHWQVSPAQLANVTQGAAKKTGRDGVYAILKELRQVGYVTTQKRASGEIEYIVFDEPKTVNPDLAVRSVSCSETDKPDLAQPDPAQPTQVKTDPKQKRKDQLLILAQQSEGNDSVSEKLQQANDMQDVVFHLNNAAQTRFQPKGQTAGLIIARMQDGFSVQDLMAVIDHKVQEWGDDARMRQYLRPATLFNINKFPGYLSQARYVRENGTTAVAVAVGRPSRHWEPDDEDTRWIHALHQSSEQYN
ncbi:conserved phage C-terminal domain-containing protein [Vibrio mangrovi]|uniref:Conserved phage C-terminal domain-containing protein n=1 Tax=Vibrio mangrovi TaxID=474394 RepID=A0A1Y6IZ08_9VIBR|nr:conserved phage C-terminal domain-containing protein [Vibrio mangrovi]MDW6005488.1 conserved phage C-terminal domain-containing protein [Vibrio mangrovi]SMS02070.1 hypothetical protein VIM7927_03384 [Vibrio mangrovi]